MDQLKRSLGLVENSPDEESCIIANIDNATTLSWSTRIKLFCICFVIGVLLSLLASFTFFLNTKNSIITFGILYTAGNILSMASVYYFMSPICHHIALFLIIIICSTCFLMGPMSQLKKMFASTRIFATCLVVLSFILTIIAACVLGKPKLVLLFIVVQSLAMTWYSLSYIPWAREAVKKTISNCVA